MYLIFERSKEELRLGKNLKSAITDGYKNAFSAIFDSNLTSIITGISYSSSEQDRSRVLQPH